MNVVNITRAGHHSHKVDTNETLLDENTAVVREAASFDYLLWHLICLS